MTAENPTVESLHADDGGDHFGWYAVPVPRGVEGVPVGSPKLHTGIDAFLGEEYPPVLVPGQRLLRGSRDLPDDLVALFGTLEDVEEPLPVEAVPCHEPIDIVDDFRPGRVVARHRLGGKH